MIFMDTSEEDEVDDERVESPPKPAPKPVTPTQPANSASPSAPKKPEPSSGDNLEHTGTCTLPSWGGFGLRHIEGKGIGYNDGYTSLDAFLLLPFPDLNENYIFFFDVRGHIFDDGKFASNVGVGARILRSHIHTIGAYYDYRETRHYHFNQLTLNYENLGKQFDWRANGYFPVGGHTSPAYGDAQFHGFEGHSMILSQKKEFAMWGINAEIGKDLSNKLPFKCYGAIGPYYFGRGDTNAWGGQARLNTEFNKYVKLEFNASYDNVFNGIVQAQLSLVWPLGPMKKNTTSKKWCSKDPLMQRVSQRVERNEIIVVDHKRYKSEAIDPATGQPYFFWFVNNLSHSQGTYESPFSNLVAAQNNSNTDDVIYVYPGDGTPNGMSNGIILKDNQRLLSSSISQPFNTTKGIITVPASTKVLPQITNSITGDGVVLLADNNEVSGFSIRGIGSTSGVLGGPLGSGTRMTSAFIDQCTIVSDGFNGLFFINNPNGGDVTISNCNVSGGLSGIHFENNLAGTITISNSTVFGNDTDAVVFVNNVRFKEVSIAKCTFSSNGGDGLNYLANQAINLLKISNCSISSVPDTAIQFKFNSNLGPTTISNCSISSLNGFGINFDTNDIVSVAGPVTISGCTISAPGATDGVSFTNNPNLAPPFRLNLFNNTITNPPPSLAGFLIDNPSPLFPENFVLDVRGNVGILDTPNPVTLVGP